jgi:hypothetical protein
MLVQLSPEEVAETLLLSRGGEDDHTRTEGGAMRVIQVDSGEQIRRARERDNSWEHKITWCKMDGLIVVSYWDERWELLSRLMLDSGTEDLPETTIDYSRVVVDYSISTRK